MVSPYEAKTKDYLHNVPRKQSIHIPVMQREKAAILYMRAHFKYSMNILAKAFSRSTNLVHEICHYNEIIGNLRWINNKRKIPPQVRRLARVRMEREMMYFMRLWMPFLLGEVDKPP